MQKLQLGLDLWCWTSQHGPPFRPFVVGKAAALRHLVEAWLRTQWPGLVSRRQEFQGADAGIDRWLSLRLLRTDALPADQQGALRAIMAGDVTTDAAAAKWTGSPLCPFCSAAPETLWHRFWECPRWERQRAAALQLPMGAAAAWARELPPLLAVTGLCPYQTPLPSPVPFGPDWPGLPCVDAQTLWSDGSCLDPLDPVLACAAWAIVDEGGRPWSGPVPGQQSAQRAEVAAVAAALAATPGALEVVTDSRYVFLVFRMWQDGARPPELNRDLWERVWQSAAGRVWTVRKIPAHLTPLQAAARGVSCRDQKGNAAADAAARAQCAALRPGAVARDARRGFVAQVARSQRALAAVHVAAMECIRGPTEEGRALRQRRAFRRRLARRPKLELAAGPGVAPAPLPPLERDFPAGLHFPSWQEDRLCCARCGLSADRAHATMLLKRPCRPPGLGGPWRQWTWERVGHVLPFSGAQCARCRGAVPASREAVFRAARCPAWWLEPLGAVSQHDWGALLFVLLGRAPAGAPHPWGNASGLEPVLEVAELAPYPVVMPAGQGQRQFLRWVPHLPVLDTGQAWCLACGRFAVSADALLASACSGWLRELPPKAAMRLLVPLALVPPPALSSVASQRVLDALQARLGVERVAAE